LIEELARPEYQQRRDGESALTRLWRWFADLFEGAPGIGLPPLSVLLLIVGIVVAVVLLARYVAGPIRLSHERRGGAVVDEDDARTAAQMRQAAKAAAREGEWSLAVTERFRAVVRGCEERVILDERSGRTAQEAATDASARLPEVASVLSDAARLFDAVLYGARPATEADYLLTERLDDGVQAAKPMRPASDTEVDK